MEAPQPLWMTLAGVLGLGAVIGSVVSHMLTVRWQHRVWVNDNKKAEWRELIDNLDTSLTRMEIAFSKSFHERAAAPVDYMTPMGIGAKVINDRIFIADVLRKRGITQRWRDVVAYVVSSDSPRDADQQGDMPTLNGYRMQVIALQDEVMRVARKDLGIERHYEVMNWARRIILAVYGLAVALAFLWVPWTEGMGYRWLWVAPRATTVDKDIVAEARQRWKAETRANDTASLGQKWAKELHEAPDTDKDKVREKIRLARDLATFRQLELSNLERMPDREVLDWLSQKDNFDTTFPEQANLDDVSRQKLLQEWKTTVHPANEWNARVGAAKIDYKHIGMEIVALTALCVVGFVLSPRTLPTE